MTTIVDASPTVAERARMVAQLDAGLTALLAARPARPARLPLRTRLRRRLVRWLLGDVQVVACFDNRLRLEVGGAAASIDVIIKAAAELADARRAAAAAGLIVEAVRVADQHRAAAERLRRHAGKAYGRNAGKAVAA